MVNMMELSARAHFYVSPTTPPPYDKGTYCFCHGRLPVCPSIFPSQNRVRPVTRKSFEILYEMFTTVRRRADHQNHNCSLPSFGTMAL